MNIAESPKEAARRLAAIPLAEGYEPNGLYEWIDPNSNTRFWRIRLKHPITSKKWIRPMYVVENHFELGEPKFKNKKPLYGLQKLADRLDCVVWIVEGENKVDALSKLGILAVTSGASDSAASASWEILTGREVMIWRDFDEAGLRYQSNLIEILSGLGCLIRCIEVEKIGLEVKGDCVDYLLANPNTTKLDIESLPNHIVFQVDKEEKNILPSDGWEHPVLFDEIITPEISSDLLPGVYGRFCKELSSATETPDALSVMMVLGVIATCLSKKFVVSPKPGWSESLNIYTLVALPPANNKSRVLKEATKPLVEWEKDQFASLSSLIRRQKSERKTQERTIEGLRQEASKKKNFEIREELQEKINAIEADLIIPTTLPVLFINDVTPETLSNQIHDQGGKLSIFSDEGGIIETLSGLYSGGSANIDIVLKGIDGGHCRIRRKDKHFDIEPFLTFVLAVQPSVIQNMGSKRSFSGNGMVERWLYVLPRSKLGYRCHNQPPLSESVRKEYRTKILELLSINPSDESLPLEPSTITLSKEALNEWKAFQSSIEIELRPNGKFQRCLGWGGKISGFTLRIAGLLHVAEHSIYQQQIDEKTMKAAVQIARHLCDHALAAFDTMNIDDMTRVAKKALTWIIEQAKPFFNKSEFTNAVEKLGSWEIRERALKELIDRNIVGSPELVGTGGRKKHTYKVNPALFKK
jgi:hypothetical protein